MKRTDNTVHLSFLSTLILAKRLLCNQERRVFASSTDASTMVLQSDGSSTRRHVRRRGGMHPARLIVIFIGFVFLILYYTGQQQWKNISGMTEVVKASQSRPSLTGTSATSKTYTRRKDNAASSLSRQSLTVSRFGVISPFTSKPPEPIALFETSSDFIRNRHKCIQQIRQRHNDLLGPYIFRKSQSSTQPSPILLVDPAYHKNVGDSMITLGEMVFFAQDQAHEVSQCGYVQHGNFIPHCDQVLSQSNPEQSPVAAWHGGGNWGDLWRIAQELRVPSFAELLGNGYSVVGMPQSLFYQDSFVRDGDTTNLKRGVGTAADPKKSVVLSWREKESFELAEKLYPFVTNLLVPDIAFQLGPYQPLKTPEADALKLDLVLFLRDDLESSLLLTNVRNDAAVRNMLSSIEGGENLSFKIVDWNDRLQIFPSQDYFFTETSIQLLSLGRVVICDRLHAAILCYLAGIPFVYIDQMTGKISKTLYVALEGCADGPMSMFERAQTLPEALQLAVEFFDKYTL